MAIIQEQATKSPPDERQRVVGEFNDLRERFQGIRPLRTKPLTAEERNRLAEEFTRERSEAITKRFFS